MTMTVVGVFVHYGIVVGVVVVTKIGVDLTIEDQADVGMH
jgi:hypothetical protein